MVVADHFGMVLHPQFAPEVFLDGKMTRLDTLSRDHHGPRAVLNALDRLTSGYASECVRVQKELGIAESQLRDYRNRLGKAFLHEDYFAELTGLRDRLKAALSGNGRDTEADSASELAKSVKDLKSGQTIASSPQRLGQMRLSAEVPVTARIHRKLEAGARIPGRPTLRREVGFRLASDSYSLLGLAGANTLATAVRPSVTFGAVSLRSAIRGERHGILAVGWRHFWAQVWRKTGAWFSR